MTFPGRIAGIFLLMVVTPALAGAQTFEPPRVTIGGAGGVSDPLHGDLLARRRRRGQRRQRDSERRAPEDHRLNISHANASSPIETTARRTHF